MVDHPNGQYSLTIYRDKECASRSPKKMFVPIGGMPIHSNDNGEHHAQKCLTIRSKTAVDRQYACITYRLYWICPNGSRYRNRGLSSIGDNRYHALPTIDLQHAELLDSRGWICYPAALFSKGCHELLRETVPARLIPMFARLRHPA
jgi:hypothetical protein